MKETFPPRPKWEGQELGRDAQDVLRPQFLLREREWFEKLAAHPHVQAVMHIPPDEPIFVVRAQDRHAPRIVTEWILVAEGNGGISDEKYDAAAGDRNAMLKWQAENADKVKQPD